MVHINILIPFVLLLLGCTNKDLETEEKRPFLESKLKQTFNSWKADSLGCQGNRNLGLAQKMIYNNNLLNKTTREFINHFGKPNNMRRVDKFTTLDYYIKSNCVGDSIIVEGSDKCWVQFKFVEDKLEEIPKVFACE